MSIITKIDKFYEDNFEPRYRLGLSQIGHRCNFFLWHKFNKKISEKAPEGRILRLFELGNILETAIIKDLQNIDLIVTEQQKKVSICLDDTKKICLEGHIDGIIMDSNNNKCLFEFKTMNAKGFKKLIKSGYESYNPIYKTQLHAYMACLELKQAFVLVYNKDTSELYQEVIELDIQYITRKFENIFDTITRKIEPKKYCSSPLWYEAKICGLREFCFNDEE